MIFLLCVIFTLKVGDTLKTEIFFQDQNGNKLYLNDTLRKYHYTIIIHSYFKYAPTGKEIREELEKKYAGGKNIKVLEVVNFNLGKQMQLIKDMFISKLRNKVKRQVFPVFNDDLYNKIGGERERLNLYIFENNKLKSIITSENKEEILENINNLIEVKN